MLPYNLPSAEQPWGQAPGQSLLSGAHLALGPGLSLVLQASCGFLQSGATGPGRCFSRPLIKTIFLNASKALGSSIFLSLGREDVRGRMVM